MEKRLLPDFRHPRKQISCTAPNRPHFEAAGEGFDGIRFRVAVYFMESRSTTEKLDCGLLKPEREKDALLVGGHGGASAECQDCSSSEREEQMREGHRIEYLSIAWTSLEALVGIIAGVAAGSVALIGFGADSVIEIGSSAILLWRLSDRSMGEQRERKALRLVGASFLMLAAYVAYESIESLAARQPPRVSYFGIIFSALCLIIMPLLARAKRRVASSLQSAALNADSKQSSICGYLGAILLGGLALNALLGWWWADPVAALAMLPIIVKEGFEALRGETCGCDDG